jgi:hypothetical protein
MDVDNNIELVSAGFKSAYGEKRGLIRLEGIVRFNWRRMRSDCCAFQKPHPLFDYLYLQLLL